MEKIIKVNDISVNILCQHAIVMKHVSIVPAKLNLPNIRPKDEVYLVGSTKHGNRIKKNATPIGFIIKSQKRCSFFSPFNINLCAETLELVNSLVSKVDNWAVYYDFKNNKWPTYLIEDIQKREQKAAELDQSTKELNKLKDHVDDLKDRLNTIMETLDTVCDQD